MTSKCLTMKSCENVINRLFEFGPSALPDLLIEYPDLCTCRCIHNETLLHFFAVEDQLPLVQALARIGCPIDSENEFGNTPLMEAILLKNTSMVRCLLEMGASPNWQSSRDGRTPMHFAAKAAKAEIWELLLAKGGNPGIEDNFGFPAEADEP